MRQLCAKEREENRRDENLCSCAIVIIITKDLIIIRFKEICCVELYKINVELI